MLQFEKLSESQPDARSTDVPGFTEFQRDRVRTRWLRGGSKWIVASLILIGIWQEYAHQRSENYFPDSSIYQVLAKNLVERQTYEFNFRPHTLYPPGFPTILALSSFVVGQGYEKSVLLMPLFGTLSSIAAFSLLQLEEGWFVGAVGALLLATSPYFFRFSTQSVLSELPFFFASTVTLLFGCRLTSEGSKSRVVTIVAFCVAMAASVMIRSVGIALVAATIATIVSPFVFRRRLSLLAAGGLVAGLATSVLVGGLWFKWALARVSKDWPGEYMNSYLAALTLKDPHHPLLGHATAGDLVTRVFHFASSQMASFSEMLLRIPWVDPVWFSPLVLIPFAFVVIGLIHSVASGRSTFMAWYVVAYLGVCALWPFEEGLRFALPVFPFMFLFAWRGARLTWEFRHDITKHPGRVRLAVGVIALGALLSFASLQTRGLQSVSFVVFWFGLFGVSLTTYLYRPVPAPTAFARNAAVWVIGALLAVGLAMDVTIAARNIQPDQTTFVHADSARLAEWLKAQPDNATTVMAQQATILHYLTGRHFVSFPTTDDGALIDSVMRQHDVAYLVVGEPSGSDYSLPTERGRLAFLRKVVPDCCSVVRTVGSYSVYRILRHPSDR